MPRSIATPHYARVATRERLVHFSFEEFQSLPILLALRPYLPSSRAPSRRRLGSFRRAALRMIGLQRSATGHCLPAAQLASAHNDLALAVLVRVGEVAERSYTKRRVRGSEQNHY